MISTPAAEHALVKANVATGELRRGLQLMRNHHNADAIRHFEAARDAALAIARDAAETIEVLKERKE